MPSPYGSNRGQRVKGSRKTPVHGAVGRAQRVAQDVEKQIGQHVRNAAGIPGDIDTNVRTAIADIFGLHPKKATTSKSSAKPKAPATKAPTRTLGSRAGRSAARNRKIRAGESILTVPSNEKMRPAKDKKTATRHKKVRNISKKKGVSRDKARKMLAARKKRQSKR